MGIERLPTKSVILPLIYYGIGKKKMYSNGLFLDLNFRLHFPLILKDFGGNSYGFGFENTIEIKGDLERNSLLHAATPGRNSTIIDGETYQEVILRKHMHAHELLVAKIALGYAF